VSDRRPARLWGGRFGTGPAAEAEALTRSLGFDVRLAPQDVEASIAHVRGLEEAGLLEPAEASALEKALREVGAQVASGSFQFVEADEDVHSAIERGVTERLGELGARLHAGRSRNDLVVTDLRLWLLDAAERIDARAVRMIRALVAPAREHASAPMPGTTHARPAQVVTLGHHLLAHAWALVRDRQRLSDWRGRASVSPLGAGALATSTLGLDAESTARRLGFDRAFENSLDAVSDRDVVQELLGACAILATHLSRIAADVARWTDPALGWARLDEAYATGSSMMPNKRNPDVAELVRAKPGRIAGDFVALTSTLSGLPLGYHRDLQEDKEPVFDAVLALTLSLPALAGCVETLVFDVGAMREAASAPDLYATDVAEALVLAGVPFRAAHRAVGDLLRRLDEGARTLFDLTDEEWAALGLAGGGELLDPDRSVAARAGRGGPSPASVLAQADAIESVLPPPSDEVDLRRLSAEDVRPVRRRVLRDGLASPGVVFADDDAPEAFHAGALLEGRPVAVATVVRSAPPGPDDGSAWQVRGMATDVAFRGRGLGGELLERCVEHARGSGGSLVWCNARVRAVAFYERHGFDREGEVFDIEGLGPHVRMRLALPRVAPTG
jgi:argininosuccinate lyase